MTLPLTTLAHLSERLQELHARTRETPLFNPVFQLGLDLSRALEGGVMDLDALEVLVGEMECTGLKARAARLERLLAPVAPDANCAALAATLARDDGFDAFAKRWETPYLHAVFTAHPTFAMSPALRRAFAASATRPSSETFELANACVRSGEAVSSHAITLNTLDPAYQTHTGSPRRGQYPASWSTPGTSSSTNLETFHRGGTARTSCPSARSPRYPSRWVTTRTSTSA